MAKRIVVHHSRGYAALLKDPAIVADLRRRAEAIAAAAGNGFEVKQSQPYKRARASVVAPNGDSENKMIRNLDRGR